MKHRPKGEASTGRIIARIFQEHTESDASWDCIDITADVADLLLERGFMKSCLDHGVFNAELDSCPHDHELGEHDEPG